MRGLVVGAVLAAVGVFAGAAAAQNTISPQCTVAGQTGDCSPGWYTSPVTVVWQATPPPVSTSPCALGIQYAFDVDTDTTLACTGTWPGPVQSQYSFPLRIEISAPAASAAPDRPPDANGWYNHPVAISFQGDAFSGIATCTAPETYGGPDTPGTALSGACTDHAGKTASASAPLRYDASPPSLGAAAQPAQGSVSLTWHAAGSPAPVVWVQVWRSPGIGGAAASVLYQGAATGYQDHRVHNGTAYTYTITAVDQAGNQTQRTVPAKPGVRLLSPMPGARLRTPPTLRWTAIRKASYYNVQLFRGSKILSAWPKQPRLRLPRSWRFGGHRHRLTRGRYRWYVWPGYGPKRAARYGRVVGTATFVIR